MPIKLTINGESYELTVPPWTTLRDPPRRDLDLTGTKKGRDHCQCGACTVLVDGIRVKASCRAIRSEAPATHNRW